jgi:spore maturation protein CgeB
MPLSEKLVRGRDLGSSESNGLRVLYLGESWWGSCTRACSSALRRLGCDVWQLEPPMPNSTVSRTLGSRIVVRITRPQRTREYNELILATAEKFQPDFVLAFKGLMIERKTLQVLRERGITLYNYYPDRVVLESHNEFGQSLCEYDCIFDTKQVWDAGAAERVKVRKRVFLPHGYDSEVHRPLQLSASDQAQYGCDVSLIAAYSPLKEEILEALVRIRPTLDLRIWGNAWERCKSPALQKYIQRWAPFGDQYARAIQATRINLGIMGITAEVHDSTSTRTYEIPACGGFMLHERNAEVLELYQEGKEMACFGSAEELAEKIDHFLAYPEERERIANAGHARCVPAYSYDARMAELLHWHRENARVKNASSIS